MVVRSVQSPVPDFMREREVISAASRGIRLRFQPLLDPDLAFREPDRPMHVGERKQRLHVLEFKRELQEHLRNLLDRNRRSRDRSELLGILTEQQFRLGLNLLFMEKWNPAARCGNSTRHHLSPFSFSLRICSCTFSNCAGVSPLASRSSFGISDARL